MESTQGPCCSVEDGQRAFSAMPRFSSEKELVRQAITQSAWRDSTSQQKVDAVTELNTPNGIVDIAFFRLRKDWREHAVIGQIPSRWAYAFRSIPYRKQFSTNELADSAGTSGRRAKEAVLGFSELGLCRAARQHQYWMKIRQPSMALHELISVEAKLRDWRRAIDQATRYLAYSDQSWVLLDAKSVRAAKENAEEFSSRNVGLASISTSGLFVIHVTPGRSTVIRDHDRWVVNSELLKRIA